MTGLDFLFVLTCSYSVFYSFLVSYLFILTRQWLSCTFEPCKQNEITAKSKENQILVALSQCQALAGKNHCSKFTKKLVNAPRHWLIHCHVTTGHRRRKWVTSGLPRKSQQKTSEIETSEEIETKHYPSAAAHSDRNTSRSNFLF